MDNAKILHSLDEFAKSKPKDIPKELEDYLRSVASSGDPVYQWSLVKCLFRQKLVNVISEFYESCPMMDVPICPNVDAFNYEIIKSRLLSRYDTFSGAPFTIQRLAELLTSPRKQYNRVDKYMRAIEKNIWVVSTREPGRREPAPPGDTNLVNGMLSNVIRTNNVRTGQERLKRRSELFDDDEAISNLGPRQKIHLSLTQPIPDSPDSPEDDGSNENDCEACEEEGCFSELIQNADDSESRDGDETTTSTSSDTHISSSRDLSENEQPIVEQSEPKTEETTNEPQVEEDKTEQKVVEDDLTISDEEKVAEEKITSCSIESVPEETEERSEDNTSPLGQSEAGDLKRKLDDTDVEEEVPCKKLETEDAEPIRDAAVESPKAVEVESVAKEEGFNLVENEDVEKKVEEIAETSETSLVEDEGREMDSAEVEDKVEMVVEDSEQAMEVDEVSTQSPMAQEDVVEPMEESDIGPS